jgi:hypothetical protein
LRRLEETLTTVIADELRALAPPKDARMSVAGGN